MYKWLFAIIAGLIVTIFVISHKLEKANENYKIAMANVKAYSNELSSAKERNTALQLTIDQLGYFNDSIIEELNNTVQELNIKKKNLKALQAIMSSFSKTDTLIFKDTIFIDPALAIDTVLKDEWYSVELGLKYPSTIAVSPCFVSKKHIVVSTRKETVNPPKKWWIFRVFQKKHKVLNINVVEQNPYVKDESSKYIEILK